MKATQKSSRIPVPKRPSLPRLSDQLSVAFLEAVDRQIWHKKALDAFASHAFTGAPNTERWCSRCTLMLPPDWKDARKPVPLHCDDPRIRPVPAIYIYDEGNPVNGVRLCDPGYAGAKVMRA